MKVQPPSLSQGGGPLTPPRDKGALREDPMEKYRKERLAFIAAMQRSSSAPEGQGEALLVKLTQDPEREVALAACHAISHILNIHGHMVDPVGALRSLFTVIESIEVMGAIAVTEDGDLTARSAFPIQTDVYQTLNVLWSTINVEQLGEELVRKLSEQFWEMSRSCLGRSYDERETCDAVGGSGDRLRATAVGAVAASCRCHGGDCLRALKSILEAAKLSCSHMGLQEQAFVLFSERASSMPGEMIDAALHHAATWLREAGQRDVGTDKRHHVDEVYDAALTAVVSFIETTIALGTISEVIDGDLCALLCEYAVDRMNGGISEHGAATRCAVDHLIQGDYDGPSKASQSATVLLQVLARLVNERETFSLVVAERVSLLEKICQSCLDDLEGPMLLPSLFLVGHVSKVSPDACRLVVLGLRETNGTDVASALVVSLAHTKQKDIRQVAAWVLGVLGSSSSPAARHVAAAGGLLTLMDTTTREDPNGTLYRTCNESCVAIISRLDCLDTLIALLKLEVAGDEGADTGESDKEREAINQAETGKGSNTMERGGHARESHCRVVPHPAQEALFQRISHLLNSDLALRTNFVQQGALEALIALGERRPELEAYMASVCNLYPQELINRCSPKYMRKLIERFKRESCCIVPAPTEHASAQEVASPCPTEPSPPADVNGEDECQGAGSVTPSDDSVGS